MTINEISEVLEKVVRDVFDGMYFMFPEKSNETDSPPTPGSYFSATVAIKNAPHMVALYGSENLVRNMASAFLGTEQSVEEADLLDVFKEATNLIGGNLVNSMAFSKKVGLDIPKVQKAHSPGDLEKVTGPVFDVEGEYLKVAVISNE